MAGQRGRSRGELIRQRARGQFVGRRAQLSLFADNLAKDPESEVDPAEFLFHVRGVGGVGKSTLLRQWQEAARRAGAVTAVVDEGDVQGVQRTLVELARQLAEQAGPLKEFDRAAEQYRRELEASAEPMPAEDAQQEQASLSSRLVTQAALGTASLLPGASVVTAMTNPDAAAQGLDRLRAGVRGRGRRARGGDAAGVSRVFVAELGRLCDRYPWVVLFFDTWEQTGRALDEWLRDLLDDAFGPVAVNVMVVLAGRDELAEREWAALRAQVADVPLEEFTEVETRALLAARGVTDPGVVEAVWQLSMGLPLLVELLALAQPGSAEDVDSGGDVVDAAVDRFVQWCTDLLQREAVLACALAPRLNEDVFAAAVPPGALELWTWWCGQPFVTGHGGYKQYHAVVRASMVRQQRTRSPRRWTDAHLRLADAHAGWRAAVEAGLPEAKWWGDALWRGHLLDEAYHRLCAHPTAALPEALELAVHAAGEDPAALWQYTDTLAQAARDTSDPALARWAERLQGAMAGDQPALDCLTGLLNHGHLPQSVRTLAHTLRGRQLYVDDREAEAVVELDRAIAADPRSGRPWALRGDAHRCLGDYERAVADLTIALGIDPGDSWSLSRRGEAHRMAGHHEQAIADLDRAIEADPDSDWAFASRGEAHREGGQHDAALADFTRALDIDPDYVWARTQRGRTHRESGRYDEAVADYTRALAINPDYSWALDSRGEAHRMAGRYDEAVADFTRALDIDPAYTWATAQRGLAHRMASRYDLAVADFDTALAQDPTLLWAFGQRGEAHRQAGRHERALTDFDAVIALDPGDAWVLGSRGETYGQLGRYDEALADLAASLSLDPTQTWVLGARGDLHRQCGRYGPAVADFTSVLALDPTAAWARVLRGAARRQAGDLAGARQDLERASAVEPADLAYRFEKVLLDTRESGFAACAQQWTDVLSAPVSGPFAAEIDRLFALFRVLLLTPHEDRADEEPVHDDGLVEAAVTFLDGARYHEPVVDLLRYLDELSSLDGPAAERARRCRRIIRRRWAPASTDPGAGRGADAGAGEGAGADEGAVSHDASGPL
ncbi:tetratricopeptide repeat protein [Streptomyces sp. NPDC051555]|uniref:tetratricopeptide repeat protein n=1 Tax=Streptomyces sp. NPDC051555 TaxID=3365657 RepID=UPI0037A3FEB5